MIGTACGKTSRRCDNRIEIDPITRDNGSYRAQSQAAEPPRARCNGLDSGRLVRTNPAFLLRMPRSTPPAPPARPPTGAADAPRRRRGRAGSDTAHALVEHAAVPFQDPAGRFFPTGSFRPALDPLSDDGPGGPAPCRAARHPDSLPPPDPKEKCRSGEHSCPPCMRRNVTRPPAPRFASGRAGKGR